jgi:hypothetical protein
MLSYSVTLCKRPADDRRVSFRHVLVNEEEGNSDVPIFQEVQAFRSDRWIGPVIERHINGARVCWPDARAIPTLFRRQRRTERQRSRVCKTLAFGV